MPNGKAICKGRGFNCYNCKSRCEDYLEPSQGTIDFFEGKANDGCMFITPTNEDKPLKIVFDENICPVYPKTRCKYSKSYHEDLEFGYECTNRNKNNDNCIVWKILNKEEQIW